jgi:cellulose synthase (UDP-forming)
VTPPAPASLIEVLSPRKRLEYRVLCALWVVAVALFWWWWLDGGHVVGCAKFLLNSALILWTMVLPAYYLFFLGRMKRPDPSTVIPPGWRVAMVVTKAPSEPFAVARATLEAMLAQRHPHDTWLADEDPTAEALEWCRSHGVRVSTRRGVTDYQRSSWPRRVRCKEGNLAYFYDAYGYRLYDLVVQMDCDQRPGRGYLEAMLRPFVDPRVGYVSAPSICDVNAHRSWAARGRLYAEGTLHGSLQAGYNAGWAPLCIGSHYAVRTAALRQIGGLGPELAEDHSTTLAFNSHGWIGVHAFDAEAHGDGPMSFEDCMTQEYQWSRSLTTILLAVTPGHWRRLPRRLRAQFLFAQLWYPCLGATMLIGVCFPMVALLTGEPWVHVSYVEFVLHKLPVTAAAFLVVLWVRRNGWLRPRESRVLTWETMLFQLARWPWVLAGSMAGVIGVARGKQVEFKITPKSGATRGALSLRVMAPYWTIAAASGAVASLESRAGDASGYYYLAIATSATYAALVFVVALMHVLEGRLVERGDRPESGRLARTRRLSPQRGSSGG